MFSRLKLEFALTKSERLFLLCIVSLSLSFLLIGLNGDSPICTENDELDYAGVSLYMVTHDRFDPGWYANPASTTIYSLAAYYKIIQLLTGNSFIDPHLTPFQMCFKHMDLLIKWPRLMSVAFLVLTLPVLYVVGRKWLGKQASMLGLLFYALSPQVIYFAQTLRPDMLANFLIVLSIFLIDILLDNPSSRLIAMLIGVVIGFAVSTRFFCLALVVPQAIVYSVSFVLAGTKRKKTELFHCALITAVTFLLTFIGSSPFVFLDFQKLLADLKYETQSNFTDWSGLGPLGNLQYYVFQGFPEAIGPWLTGFAAVGLVIVLIKRRTFATVLYLILLAVFAVGICLNPRHWPRWVLPMLPLVSLLVGYGLTSTYELLVCLISKCLSSAVARIFSFTLMFALCSFAFFFPTRRLIADQWQKSHLSERALVFPFITSSIPVGAKIALDTAWEWPNQESYNVSENIWRPDFVPPRQHNYFWPEDLANDGFQYMIVQRWNRIYYMRADSESKYPREYAFFHALSRRSRLICDTYNANHPWVLGKQVGWRVTPIEVYDLRPLAKKPLSK